MSLVTPENFGILYFALILSIIPFCLGLLVMHFLMPKAVVARYWKEPHFRLFELHFFSGLAAPMRSWLFMVAIAVPRLGKKRRLVDVRRMVPRWYRIASIAFVVWLAIALTGIVGIGLGFGAYFYFVVDSDDAIVQYAALMLLALLSIPIALWLERRRRRRLGVPPKTGASHRRTGSR